ncbi:hypothetical protein pb186bvf_010604 [Paramecium bursaria]
MIELLLEVVVKVVLLIKKSYYLMEKENQSQTVSEHQSDKTAQTQDKSRDLSVIMMVSESIVISKNNSFLECPKCKKKVDPMTKYRTTCQTIIAALAARQITELLLISFLCCCCIPLLIKDCKNQQQVCPTCSCILEEKKYEIC